MTAEEVLLKISEFIHTSPEESAKIFEKAVASKEITDDKDTGLIDDWFNNRFKSNIVFIDQEGYAKMCIDALKIVGTIAATDYGSSRQRDLGQLWADMTRGYLGELAFTKLLKERWDIDSTLDHSAGALDDFINLDIHKIKKPNELERPPKLNIGIKTTKWNGIWLDIPGDQFNHSDIHIFIKVGTGRDHLFAYFREISVFKDKILKKGTDSGILNQSEADDLYDKLPKFHSIPAYICGFVERDKKYKKLSYGGSKGRKNYKIDEWHGPMEPSDLPIIKEKEEVYGKVSFEGIGEFSNSKRYLFNAGNLLWKKEDWDKVIERI